MGNRKLIVIGNDSICLKAFKKLVYNYKICLEEKNVKEINITLAMDFHKAALIMGALSAKCKINITISNDCEGSAYTDFIMKLEDLKETDKKFRMDFDDEDSSAIAFNDEEITYKEMKSLLKRISGAFGKSNIFYVNGIESLNSLCIGFILPVCLGNLLVYNDDMGFSLKKHKPTVFVGGKKRIKKLYNLIFEATEKRKMKEFLFGLFKDWDNGILSVFINRFVFFNPFKNLKIIIAEEHNDFKGLWLDFESLGIELYSQKILMEKEREQQ